MEILEEYVSHRKLKNGTYEITCQKTFGFPILWRWLGTKQKTVKYYGSGTVWRKVDGFTRCNSFEEGWLSDIYASIQYDEVVGEDTVYDACINSNLKSGFCRSK